MQKNIIIISPHGDDEIIGCHSILKSGNVNTVLYSEKNIIQEAKKVSEYFSFKIDTLNNLSNYLNKGFIFYFPDPIYELHPLHRKIGAIGESLLRIGHTIIFYSTNMNAPYIREIDNPQIKRSDLEQFYFNKKSLWKYDYKYFLFEGQVKWIM